MSDFYLPIGLLATFAAVAAVVLGMARARADRHRAVEILQSQVEPVPLANVREQELHQPFADRAMRPFLTTIARAGRRLTPLDVRDRLAHKIVIAILTATGYFLPDVVVSRTAEQRQKGISRALADTMDLLTISVEAGLGFDAALAQVVEHVPGPLSEEISRMLQEIQLGKPRADAFRAVAERSSVDELNSFVLSVIQADVFGLSISAVLRAQAKDLRVRRRQKAEERALKVPVKLLFPMIFCILPLIMIVVAGPAVIKIFHALLGPGGLFSTGP